MNLAAYRTAIGEALGSAFDAELWTDAVLDAGLREALREYNEAAPVVETGFTVVAAGRTQDLGSVADILRLGALAWPWHDGARFEALAQRWVYTGPAEVRFLDCEPAVNDVIRVRYRRAHAVEDLDGAPGTTVRACDERLVCQGAAGHAALIRYRQIIETEGHPQGALKDLWYFVQRVLGEYRAALEVLTWEGAMPVRWGHIGL